ncbi:MAG: TRAP transporter small permease, partial [Candidatus Parcubacteria bacterium]|nr:TRAP transporter small permease [Burkholderiales bacterium]
LALTSLFAAYMVWAVVRFVFDSWRFHEVAQGLIKIPIWLPQLAFALGVIIFLVAVLDDLVAVLRRQKPSYQLAEEDRRARRDFSEMA